MLVFRLIHGNHCIHDSSTWNTVFAVPFWGSKLKTQGPYPFPVICLKGQFSSGVLQALKSMSKFLKLGPHNPCTSKARAKSLQNPVGCHHLCEDADVDDLGDGLRLLLLRIGLVALVAMAV